MKELVQTPKYAGIYHLLTDPAGDPWVALDARPKQEYVGETISSFLNVVEWDRKFHLPTICVMNGEPVLRSRWDEVRITSSDVVEFWSHPTGGHEQGAGGADTGKGLGVSIGVLLGMVAATALLWWAAPALAGAIGVSQGIVTAVGGLLISGGGMLLLQFLMPKAGAKTDPTKDTLYSIGQEGNIASPLEPIPVGYGRRLLEPKFAAQPYTSYSGPLQILYELFVIGVGEYDMEEVRINDTRFWDPVAGITTAFVVGADIEFYGPGEQVTLFPTNVTTSEEVSGLEIALFGITYGPFTANAAGTLANKIIIDIVFPQGIYGLFKGRLLAIDGGLVVEYRPIDDAGAPIAPGTFASTTILVHIAQQSEYRMTREFTVTPARYEVQVKLISAVVSGTQPNGAEAHNEVTWMALRANLEGPNAYPDVTTMALKITASELLSGLSSRRISTIQTRKLPIYDIDTGTFSAPEPTRNPIDAVFDIWRNNIYSAGLNVANLDTPTMVAYRTLFDDLGHTFDHFYTSQISIYEALEVALKVVKSVPAFVGDKLTVVRDEQRDVPRQFFTDREIIRGSLSIHRRLMDEEFADGVTLQYLDEETWNFAEVSSSTTLVNPAVVQIDGVVRRSQAYGLVLYLAAVNRFRRRGVSFDIELEGRMIKRGDLIALQSSVPRTWGASTSAISYDDDTHLLEVSNPVPWNESGDHFIEVRDRSGGVFGPVKVSFSDEHVMLIDTTDLAAVETAQSPMTLLEALTRDDPTMEYPSIAFSPGQPRTFRGLVQSAAFTQHTCTVNIIIERQEVYDVDETIDLPPVVDYPPPPPTPGIPVVTGVTGSVVQNNLSWVLSVSWNPVIGADSYSVALSLDGGNSYSEVGQVTGTTLSQAITVSDDMLVTVSARNPSYGWGPPSSPPLVVVAGELVIDDTVDPNLPGVGVNGMIADILDPLNEISIPFARTLLERLAASTTRAATLAYEFWSALSARVAVLENTVFAGVSIIYATVAEYRSAAASKPLSTDSVWPAAAFVTLTDAATVTTSGDAGVNFSKFINATVTLGGNRTLGAPSNATVGKSGVIEIFQDGTGSRTLAFASGYIAAGGLSTIVLTTTAGARDELAYGVMPDGSILISHLKDCKA